MNSMVRTALVAIMGVVGALSVGAASPLRETLASEGLSADLASVNAWKPELPIIQPISAVQGDDAPEYLDDMLSLARDYLGLRYRRGGKTPKGFDCSGFTGYIFSQFGIKLNASSSAQYQQGEPVADGELRPGDLVFFSGRAGGRSRVGHVGLVTEVAADGTFRFIHSSNSHGIVVTNSTAPYYSRRYIGARRVR